ncbi:MAG: alpha/beta hydrolase [Methyloversatilis sp.]|nr:alpha/beta hydrolase [Methyloversatilis sp.]
MMPPSANREAIGMRTDIEFRNEDGITLRGWHYAPDSGSGPFPTIILAHGFSAVKEMYLDRFAEAFALAGMASIVFDHRNFGASGGEMRQEIDPWCQIRDYRDAITFAETLPQTDPSKIGIWGSSYSGGHVLVVGAIDRRVKAIVAQVPLISGHANARRLIRADFIAGFQKACEDDRRARARGEAPAMIPVIAQDPMDASALPTADSWDWFSTTHAKRAPSWKNEVTLRSVEMFTEYEPGSYIPFISPTPLLMVVALGDHLTVADEALGAYERALHPKKLVTLKGGHFDAYVTDFASAAAPATAWFREHLGCASRT